MALIDIVINTFYICASIGFTIGAICLLVDAHKDENK